METLHKESSFILTLKIKDYDVIISFFDVLGIAENEPFFKIFKKAIYKLSPFELGDDEKILKIEIEYILINKLLSFCNSCSVTSLYKDQEFQKPINRFERHLEKIKAHVEEITLLNNLNFNY